VTETLAHYLVTATYDDLPENVRKEGARTLLNWVGVAIGGSRHPTVDIAVAALTPFSGPAQASLLGRRERFDRTCHENLAFGQRKSDGTGSSLARCRCLPILQCLPSEGPERVAGNKMALNVECILDDGVNSQEPLR
jgi:MmgE/PrpD N-terminal domain